MVILQDTREKINKKDHILNSFKEKGINVVRNKLFVGDYTRADRQNISVDVKQNWLELVLDICGKQHERFRNECLRAKSAGIRLIILVEEQICVEQWKSPLNRQKRALTQVKGETLAKAMRTMTEKYGVEFMNCDKKDTAEIILKLLGE